VTASKPAPGEIELLNWMDDMESEDAARDLAAERLAAARPTTARDRVFMDSAQRWLDRGRGGTALALLDRIDAPPPNFSPSAPRAATDLPIDTLMRGLPGFGGLPALTTEEAASLRACLTPEEALVVIAGARRRLDAHGREARRLLRNWVERERR
jgi:hypothetical protein